MNNVLLITGGSRGIGAATARLAGVRGYDVCVNYRTNRRAAEEVVRDIEQVGGRAVAVAADVAVERDVMQLFEACDAAFGPLTALVNNAGILEPQMRLETMDVGRMQRIFGAGGSIVNLSSGAARLGAPGEYVDYAASKGAIDTFTIGLAQEVAEEGIRVNAVRPGFIYTDIHASGGEPGRVDRVKAFVPMKRGGLPEEVAHAILWLLSGEASFTTGAFIDVTGGR
jgi:NAD(P)-dependent dehydrogenase (short-subunit alcohol dehydrogenase family)